MRRHSRQPPVHWWQWPNLLGLDAPLVAIFWQHLLAVTGKVRLSGSIRLGLFLAVWAVYLADRLLDSRTPHLEGDVIPARHRFARNHARWLVILLSITVSAAGVLAWTLKPPVRIGASFAAGGVLGYLAAVHLRRRTLVTPVKEVLVAILFATGTAIAPLIRAEVFNRTQIAICALLAGFLFYLNLVAVEYHEGCVRPQPSGATRSTRLIGANVLRLSLLLAITAGTTALFVSSSRIGASAVALAAAALFLVEVTSDKYGVDALRVLWDAALLLPAVFLSIWF